MHIPYCVQRCRYCDFTTFEQSQIMPPEKYVQLVLKEIEQRHLSCPSKEIGTLYFGGGTPSLLKPELILTILQQLANVGFRMLPDAEVTIEINPATIDQEKLAAYQKMGINRFSVGAQSFNDTFLQNCGRRHTAEDTRSTLRLLKEQNLSFSFDLLFALPGQGLKEVKEDLDEALAFETRHMSLYCLTVPEGHPMSFGRAPEGEQIEMFDLIDRELRNAGLHKYEISNYAFSGFESRHNLSYWNDREYWGLGLSAHSYFKSTAWGTRFWNPKNFELYESQLSGSYSSAHESFPVDQFEVLRPEEALTDFCHMAFRQPQGLHKDAVQNRWGGSLAEDLNQRLVFLQNKKWLRSTDTHWQLTFEGEKLLNQVLLELSFG